MIDLAQLPRDKLDALYNALRLIANAEELHGDTVVCDFQTLQTIAWHALTQLEPTP